MSILVIAYSVITTGASFILDYKRRKKIRNLRAGQKQWRECALEAQQASKNHWAEKCKIRASLKEVSDLHSKERFELRKVMGALYEDQPSFINFDKMAQDISALKAQLAGRIQDLNLAKASLRDLQAVYLKQKREAEENAKLAAVRAEKGLQS